MTTLDKLLQAELSERKPDPLYGQPQTRSILPDDPSWVWKLFIITAVLWLLIL